jgi:hypothetical protein
MPNPKGNPDNLNPLQPKNEQPMTRVISFRATKEMEELVKSQADPPEFCRRAIQDALDKQEADNSNT